MTIERGYNPHEFVVAGERRGRALARLGAVRRTWARRLHRAGGGDCAIGLRHGELRSRLYRRAARSICACRRAAEPAEDRLAPLPSASRRRATRRPQGLPRWTGGAAAPTSRRAPRVGALPRPDQSSRHAAAGRRCRRGAMRRALARFEEQYETLFGAAPRSRRPAIEILSVQASGRRRVPPPAAPPAGEPLLPAPRARWCSATPKTPVERRSIRRQFPAAGCAVEGPCIIEFPGQSVVVPPGATARADDTATCIVTWVTP